LKTILQEFGNRIYDAFVLPGNYLLSKLAALVPGLASDIGLVGDDRSVVLLVALSLAAWVVLILIVRKVFGLYRSLARIVNSTLRTIWFRILLALANFKTRLVCGLKRLIPRRSRTVGEISQVQIDDRDLDVLRSAAARGPGFTTSAPELAEQLPLRAAQIQRSLDRLCGIKMLEYAIGSTDGFDNYRLSPMGTAFVVHWERQAAVL